MWTIAWWLHRPVPKWTSTHAVRPRTIDRGRKDESTNTRDGVRRVARVRRLRSTEDRRDLRKDHRSIGRGAAGRDGDAHRSGAAAAAGRDYQRDGDVSVPEPRHRHLHGGV